jgi:hypothetical protein
MRIKTIALSMILAGAALAADVTGKWVAQQPGRDGTPREVTYNLKADGDALTGDMAGAQGAATAITNGKIKGEDISFTVKREMNGNTMVMSYKGKVSGDEIKFSVMREGADQAREFTAKRAK